ncbi:MAG: transporter, partial [Sinomicrobium sp.]|nr:transporter [Sinomicrobium sp.]
IALLEDIIKDYQQLVSAEERKFGFGESSVFLINSRELGLINARLKQNELHTSFMERKAALFRTLVTEY